MDRRFAEMLLLFGDAKVTGIKTLVTWGSCMLSRTEECGGRPTNVSTNGKSANKTLRI